MSEPIPAFATCPRGLESLLLSEIGELGITDARETVAGVRFAAQLVDVYRLCLWSRLANRVLLPLARFSAPTSDAVPGANPFGFLGCSDPAPQNIYTASTQSVKR